MYVATLNVLTVKPLYFSPQTPTGFLKNASVSSQARTRRRTTTVVSPRTSTMAVAERSSLYEVLRVNPTATMMEIKAAYQSLAKVYHPDFFPSEELITEPLDAPQRSGDSISVTIRFRPLSEIEFQRGDEISRYADGDKLVRNEYNPATAYAFDRVFGPHSNSQEVYDVAAKPVVKAAMEGVNGTVFL
ncbi:hypothetical protein ACOSQ2_030835 [Xanthoceras sorbifolium]